MDKGTISKATISEVMRLMGSKGGKRCLETMSPAQRKARARKGGKRCLETMSPAQRTARAKRAAAASAKVRSKKKRS